MQGLISNASRTGSGSRAHAIKMPRASAPAAKAKVGTGHEPASFPLSASLPPPISSVHGRPSLQRHQAPAAEASNTTPQASSSRTTTTTSADRQKIEHLRRPRPLPSFESPAMTLTDREIAEDKELARIAAEKRGAFPGGPGRGFDGDEEEDDGAESSKRKWKKKKRKHDAPALNMDADYDPRLPNDYAAFRALLRERRTAEREHARERAGAGEEEWQSDDDDDDDNDDYGNGNGRDDESERRYEDESRRKMMRFAPPSSYGGTSNDAATRAPAMTYAERTAAELEQHLKRYPSAEVTEHDRWSVQPWSQGGREERPRDAGFAAPSSSWSRPHAGVGVAPPSQPRGFALEGQQHRLEPGAENRAGPLNVSEAMERAKRIAQSLSAAHGVGPGTAVSSAAASADFSDGHGQPPLPVAPSSQSDQRASSHIHPARLAQMQADRENDRNDAFLDIAAGPPPGPPPAPGPPPPVPPEPSVSSLPLRFQPSTDPRLRGRYPPPAPPQQPPSVPVGSEQAQTSAGEPHTQHQQQEHEPRPAWSADKTGVVARLMAQMGHRAGEGLGADGNQGMLKPLRVQQQTKPTSSSTAGNSGMVGKRGTITSSGGGGASLDERYGEASEVVLLENMVGLDGVDDSLGDEIREECTKYGRVARVFIYPYAQHSGSSGSGGGGGVRIFVAFDGPAGAWQAVRELDGRHFGGRTVKARYYPRAEFQRGEYHL